MTRYFIPPAERFFLYSRHVEDDFFISVSQPITFEGDEQRLPVVVITDGDAQFDCLGAISHALQVESHIPRHILVAIGYANGGLLDGQRKRCRDLITDDFPVKLHHIGSENSFTDILPPGPKTWGHADDFLAFLEEKLLPHIDEQFPTIPSGRTYFGHSQGGFFGLHAFLNKPDLFDNYALSSPGLADAETSSIFSVLDASLPDSIPVEKKFFISTGDLEETEPGYDRFRITSNAKKMAGMLSDRAESKDSVHFTSFANENHLSVWPLAFSQSIRHLMGRPAEPYISHAPAPVKNDDAPARTANRA